MAKDTLPKLWTSTQAAADLGVSRRTVHQMTRRLGVGQKVGANFVFTESDMETMRNRRTVTGPVPGYVPDATSWRESNPDRDAELRKGQREREYQRRKEWPKERLEVELARLDGLDAEAQEITLASATRSKEPWEPWEDELVMQYRGKGVAIHLGRTLQAVRSRRKNLRKRAVQSQE